MAHEYLWSRQHEAGETEGRKPRPIVLVATFKDANGQTNLIILAITSTPPTPHRLALEIPELERRRAGLDDDKPLWIIVDEFNHDILETTYYFNPSGKIGHFGEAFHKHAFGQLLKNIRTKIAKRVPRRE